MNDYFKLVTEEFKSKSKQLNQFIKHGPSLGTANEVILRNFLKGYLPKWVSVGQGFIAESDGTVSNQTDIIIYNSTYYAPLYQVEDLVVVPAESVLLTVEVKTKIDKEEIHNAIAKMISTKKINKKIETLLFIYNPPKKIETIKDYLVSYDFSNTPIEYIPDAFYGIEQFKIFKGKLIDEELKKQKKYKVGYLGHMNKSDIDFVIEQFYFDIYSKVEMLINNDIKSGIDNVWYISEGEPGVAKFQPHGRVRYSKPAAYEFQIISPVSDGILDTSIESDETE
ncbi:MULTISPECIES: DUF6602 domain-containing protein [unclassified Bacillus (in: firmicutes)]|uniref:DUF6602 domain-containing protein n=1 Tax=unclassified Bacillus (in: firmicutes) TaxID=185979 RepID=UPI001BE74AC3|nr:MULTISPECIES: DUF6602 domain-containing protein [unclassified Bacillus (in: firmicutes)]MBT2616131.1 hypothetical protein [Bacillus sp. ISL-78]MBT2628419.1 hypothetical protein [Bacillus sp. ISL-101]